MVSIHHHMKIMTLFYLAATVIDCSSSLRTLLSYESVNDSNDSPAFIHNGESPGSPITPMPVVIMESVKS